MKIYTEQHDGWKITVDLKGQPIEEYAKNFLAIFNNVREYPNAMVKVENYYDNRISVWCYDDFKAETTEFLEQFGEITDTEKVLLIEADYEYNFDKYEEAIIFNS